MKLIFLFTALCCHAQLALQRTDAGLVLQSTQPAFSVRLEAAGGVDGCWETVATASDACPVGHTFTVQPTNGARFYRVRYLDDGVVPTPDAYAFPFRDGWAVGGGRVFLCDDSEAENYHLWRDGVEIASGRAPGFIDHPPSGWHTYQIQASVGNHRGFLSDAVTINAE